MSLTSDEHTLRIDGSEVRIVGETRAVDPLWRLLVDDVEVDSREETGSFSLTGTLPSGEGVEAQVRQGSFGPTEVSLVHRGEIVTTWKGFVL